MTHGQKDVFYKDLLYNMNQDEARRLIEEIKTLAVQHNFHLIFMLMPIRSSANGYQIDLLRTLAESAGITIFNMDQKMREQYTPDEIDGFFWAIRIFAILAKKGAGLLQA